MANNFGAISGGGGGSGDSGGVEIVLLWKNASITSSFAAQKIPIDLSGYDMFIIIFSGTGTRNADESNASVMFSKYSKTVRMSNSTATAPDLYNYTVTRSVSVSEDGLTFTDNNRATMTTATEACAIDNSYNLPFEIYGIKGVIS